jgi:hypothetical protein
MRGNDGALNESFKRIREQYNEIMLNRGHQKGIRYRLVLTVDTDAMEDEGFKIGKTEGRR